MFRNALALAACLCLSASLFAQSFPFGLVAASVNGNTQTLGADCSGALPCQIELGGQVLTITSPSTITAPNGTNEQAFEYLDALNPTVLTVGTNTAALTCGTGAACKTGITQFPQGSYPLYQWAIVNGTWQSYQVSYDKRSLMTAPVPLTPGPGITLTQTSGLTQIGVDPAYLSAGSASTGVSSVNGRTGAVVLTAVDIVTALNLANGVSVATKSGTSADGHLAVWSNGNLIDGGAVPTASGSTGVFTSPVSITTPGTANVATLTSIITDKTGYATYGAQSDTGQLFTWGVGGSDGIFPNSLYFFDNTTRKTIFSVAPSTDQASFGQTLNAPGFSAGGTIGVTRSVVVGGTCTIVFTGGLATSVSGC